MDTIVLGSGDTIFPVYSNYTWSLTIANEGDDVVDHYSVSSTRMGEIGPPFIRFSSEDPLGPGESRDHEGDFRLFQQGGYTYSSYRAWVGTDRVDANCSDNHLLSTIPTSVNEEVLTELVITPNPTSDFLTINIATPFSYRVFDISGSLLLSERNRQYPVIDVSGLTSGLYYLEILSGGIGHQQKFIKM